MGERLDEVVENERETKGAEYDASFTEMIAIRKSNTENLLFRFLHKIAYCEKDRMGSGLSLAKLSVSLLSLMHLGRFWELVICFENGERRIR